MRYIIRLSYDGSAFCGWQIQNNAVTVQGELQDALAKLTGSAVQVTGAGRTDTDVNSVNYIAHFDLPDTVRIVAERLCYKLNAILPKTISIHDIVYAEKINVANEGDIVVALIDDEATVKRFSLDKQGKVILLPENEDFEPIIPDENLSILGRVIASFREY